MRILGQITRCRKSWMSKASQNNARSSQGVSGPSDVPVEPYPANLVSPYPVDVAKKDKKGGRKRSRTHRVSSGSDGCSSVPQDEVSSLRSPGTFSDTEVPISAPTAPIYVPHWPMTTNDQPYNDATMAQDVAYHTVFPMDMQHIMFCTPEVHTLLCIHHFTVLML